MGINIYCRWATQTDDELQEQGEALYKIDRGGVGYLREACLCRLYATHALVPEAFSEVAAKGVSIPAAKLRSRLPSVLDIAQERVRGIFKAEHVEKILKSFTEFVELCEDKESQTGEPCRIIASF